MKLFITVLTTVVLFVYPVTIQAQPRPMGMVATPTAMPAPAPVMAEMAPPASVPMASLPAMAPTPIMAPTKGVAAQEPAPAAPGPARAGADGNAVKWIGILTPIILGILGLFIIVVLQTSSKDMFRNARLQLVLKLALENWGTVETVAKVTGWKGASKLAQLLKRMAIALQAAGQMPLSVEEEALVKKMASDQAMAEKVENDRTGSIIGSDDKDGSSEGDEA